MAINGSETQDQDREGEYSRPEQEQILQVESANVQSPIMAAPEATEPAEDSANHELNQDKEEGIDPVTQLPLSIEASEKLTFDSHQDHPKV